MSTPTIVALHGTYDARRRDELDRLLDRYGDIEPLILDLHEVEGMEPAALQSLAHFQSARTEAGCSPLILARVPRIVLDELGRLNLDHAFQINEQSS